MIIICNKMWPLRNFLFITPLKSLPYYSSKLQILSAPPKFITLIEIPVTVLPTSCMLHLFFPFFLYFN